MFNVLVSQQAVTEKVEELSLKLQDADDQLRTYQEQFADRDNQIELYKTKVHELESSIDLNYEKKYVELNNILVPMYPIICPS